MEMVVLLIDRIKIVTQQATNTKYVNQHCIFDGRKDVDILVIKFYCNIAYLQPCFLI